jgi:hypothetical protein
MFVPPAGMLLLIRSSAVFAPVDVGANLTLIVHVAPPTGRAATPQVLPVTLN